MVALPVLFLLGSLFSCGPVEADSTTAEMLKEAAIQYKGPLTCKAWDCNCTFTHQRGCCCAANDWYQLEDDTFTRMKNLYHDLIKLNSKALMLIDGAKVAFKATIDPNATTHGNCFGPFNIDMPIPYGIVSFNDGYGYNPNLGIFTAPCAGVYVFSITIYSSVDKDSRLYHDVRLMKNKLILVSVWENNREDHEDNASQVVVVEMHKGDQVYVELIAGRNLCRSLKYNIFTGYILYPYTDDKLLYYDYSD
ncbi:cerebellin 18 [Stegastes partitus]|uniref:Caprin-2-like n=1 Tax=Stegastes partitus TaxID=144197 RepID=A0A3B5ABZ6_9TELE|nr:PREDICTED: caprin-2-like [Stegastes partitus]